VPPKPAPPAKKPIPQPKPYTGLNFDHMFGPDKGKDKEVGPSKKHAMHVLSKGPVKNISVSTVKFQGQWGQQVQVGNMRR
jgi:hypothetical protein